MSKIRVADFVAQWIVEKLGVSHVPMVTGAGVMHLTDGVAKRNDLQGIFLHHEQSVSMAVEAFSRKTGVFGVAYVSTGPAATNALTGLAGAWQDSVACLFISGQVKVSESSHQAGVPGLRQFGVQELDILPLVGSLTKYSTQVSDPDQILYHLQKSLHYSRTGRPGPSWLEIPLDVQAAVIDDDDLVEFEASAAAQAPNEGESLVSLMESLGRSSRPVVLVGQGVRLAGQVDELRKFVSQNSVPVVSTYLGVDSYVPHDDLYVGKIGIKGERAANIALQKADFVLSLGSSLHISAIGYNYQAFAPSAEKWVIDIDLTSHRKLHLTNTRYLEMDLRQFFPRLTHSTSTLTLPAWDDWSEVCRRLRGAYTTWTPDYDQCHEGINIYSVINEVNKILRPGDTVISDAGSAFYAVSQGVRLPQDTRYITSGAMATMGYSLPAAIGVALDEEGGRVIAFTGDGSLQQNIQELGQLGFLKLPVVMVVLNNSGYLSIRASQRNYFSNRLFGTDEASGLRMPSVEKISQAYDVECRTVASLRELKEVLSQENLGHGPLVLNVVCPPNQEIIPTVSSKINTDGSMESRDLQDMTPLLSPELLESIMSPRWGLEDLADA